MDWEGVSTEEGAFAVVWVEMYVLLRSADIYRAIVFLYVRLHEPLVVEMSLQAPQKHVRMT